MMIDNTAFRSFVYSCKTNNLNRTMPILHSVYFYFKPETDLETVKTQQDVIETEFSTIESIDQLMVGGPEGIIRDVVDNTYGTSLHAVVADLEALKAYQEHPIHLDFLARFKSNWSAVKIYDTRI